MPGEIKTHQAHLRRLFEASSGLPFLIMATNSS